MIIPCLFLPYLIKPEARNLRRSANTVLYSPASMPQHDNQLNENHDQARFPHLLANGKESREGNGGICPKPLQNCQFGHSPKINVFNLKLLYLAYIMLFSMRVGS